MGVNGPVNVPWGTIVQAATGMTVDMVDVDGEEAAP